MFKKYILLIVCIALGLMLADAPDSYALGTKPGTGKITWKHIIYFGHGWDGLMASSTMTEGSEVQSFVLIGNPLKGIRGGFFPLIWIVHFPTDNSSSNGTLISTGQKAVDYGSKKTSRILRGKRHPGWNR